MDDNVPSVINNTETFCILQSKLHAPPEGEVWCNWAWDSVLCWPPTKAFSTTKLRCPHLNGIDTRKFIEKFCDGKGRWEGCCETDDANSTSIIWTNYTSCYTAEMLMIVRKLFTGKKNSGQLKLDIAAHTRTLEFIGLSISLLSILVSLVIFCRFRSLRNTRTRIHKNLFVAMMIQIVMRLTIYIDQALEKFQNQLSLKGIQNTPFLCEISYVLLEYARTAVFIWMFIEGLFLNNIVSARVFKEDSHYRLYRIVGWGCPVIMTVTWAIVTAFYFHPFRCWWGYSFSLYFWILEGPRLTVILFNFLFLLNIIRALLGKLRQSHTSEIEQARKAVRATLVLLPLLGITNLINVIEAPLEKTLWEFAIWSYTTHFLKSFEGLFISSFYCFLNGEVRIAIDKTISTYMLARETDYQTRRQSSLSGNNPHKENSDLDEEESRTSGWSTFLCKGDGTATPERPNEYVLYT